MDHPAPALNLLLHSMIDIVCKRRCQRRRLSGHCLSLHTGHCTLSTPEVAQRPHTMLESPQQIDSFVFRRQISHLYAQRVPFELSSGPSSPSSLRLPLWPLPAHPALRWLSLWVLHIIKLFDLKPRAGRSKRLLHHWGKVIVLCDLTPLLFPQADGRTTLVK